jgi:hypothetical protein
METRGIYDREGELFASIQGTRVYDLNGDLVGEVRGRIVVDLRDERRWMIDGDALLDLHANVIGYLGTPVPYYDTD